MTKHILLRCSFFLLLICSDQFSFSQNNIIDSLKNDLSESKENIEKAHTLFFLGKAYDSIADYQTAIEFLRQSLSLCQKSKLKKEEAKAYKGLGVVYMDAYDYEEARKNFYEAIKIIKETGDNKLPEMYLLIAETFKKESNLPASLKNQLEALRIYEKNEDKRSIAELYDNIGTDYLNFGNVTEAAKYFSLSLKLCREIGAEDLIAAVLIDLAIIDFDRGNEAAAIDSVLIALKRSQKFNDEYGVFMARGQLGTFYYKQGRKAEKNKNHSLAMEKYRQQEKILLSNLDFVENIHDTWGRAKTYYGLGRTYMRMKQYSKARYWIEKCNQLVIASKSKSQASENYLALSMLDSLQGNYIGALNNYKRFVSYNDSIINDENSQKITRARIQYEFDKKKDSLDHKEFLTLVKFEAQRKQKYFYLAGLVLVAALGFFIFLSLRNQKKINKLMIDANAKEKAELELQSLRAQLNPHFMFNSLNAIQELILKEDFDRSHTYLARFAKLLRMLVENAEKPFIPLQKEIDFLQLYLSLENLRIPDLKFFIQTDPSINSDATLIPNMILQPYIENAIWHGLSHRQGDKKLQILISKFNGAVQYDIEDNGVGRKRAAELKSLYRKEHKSKGMELLTKRFKLLSEEYGSDIDTEISDIKSDGETKGTKVSIIVPDSLSNQFRKSMQ